MPPKGRGTNTPSTRHDWAVALLKSFNAPLSAANVDFILGWMNKENTAAAYNPLAITEGPGTGLLPGNSAGVKAFASFAQGVQATHDFLVRNGYTAITDALKSGQPSFNSGVTYELHQWSGQGYSTFDVGNWHPDAPLGHSLTGGGGGGGGAGGNPGTSAAELTGILRGFGLDPHMFNGLIHEAVTNQWSPAELEGQIYGSPQFRNAFPGIFNADGSLKMTAAQWNDYAFGQGGIRDIATNYDIKVSREHIGQLMAHDVSPTEWAQRAQIYETAKGSEVYRQSFNQVLKAAGQPTLDEAGWWNFIAGKNSARIENVWEASSLKATAGLDITPKQALAASKDIGQTGEIIDMRKLVEQVQATKDLIAPELKAAQITDADLAVLSSGADPKGIASQLNQILKNRQALVGARSGGVPSAAGGGMFPARAEGM